MSEIVYSSQRRGFQPGRIYKNPRYFDGVLAPGATSVIVVGDWPGVVAAYEKAGIPVTKVAANATKLPDTKPGGKNVSLQVTTEHPDSIVKKTGEVDPPLTGGKADHFEIPDNLDDLSLKELRALVTKIDPDADIAKKADALSFLEDYRKGKTAG